MTRVVRGDVEYTVDGFVQKILDPWVPLVREKDWDFMCIIDGLEGSGKSKFSAQCAKYMDPDFNVDRMCFTAEEFNKVVREAPKNSAVVWDEALLGGKGEDWAGTAAKTLRKTIGQVRQRNLFMFLNIPSFFELHKNYAVHRSRVLFNVYTKDFERGYWRAWDTMRKQTLYDLGKTIMNHSAVKPNLYGSFSNVNVIDWVAYTKKKEEMLNAFDQEEKITQNEAKLKVRTFHLLQALRKMGLDTKQTAEVSGMSVGQVQRWLRGDDDIKKLLEMEKNGMLRGQNVGIGGSVSDLSIDSGPAMKTNSVAEGAPQLNASVRAIKGLK